MFAGKKLPLPGGAAAWKAAAWIFLLSRFVILICTYMGMGRFKVNAAGAAAGPHECLRTPGLCLRAWYVFDTPHFVAIAHSGYQNLPAYETAFFPLYPLLVRPVGWLFGGSLIADYYASLVIANLCFYFALVALYCLVCEDFDSSVAKDSLFFMAFSPFALFFFAGYSESRFFVRCVGALVRLLLCLGALMLLRQGRPLGWWLAALCGGGAVLTRGAGLVLLLVFSIVFLQRFWPAWRTWRERWPQMLNALLSTSLILLGLGLYMLYLWLSRDNPLLFSSGERHFGRILTWPWMGIVRATQNLLFISMYRDARNLVDLIFTILPLAIVVAGWKRLPLSYNIFALAVAVFSLMYPWPAHDPLGSAPRYLLMMFPVYIMLALWSKRPRVRQACIVVSLTFFVINTVLFITWNWVG
jgi:hypothetical protein